MGDFAFQRGISINKEGKDACQKGIFTSNWGLFAKIAKHPSFSNIFRTPNLVKTPKPPWLTFMVVLQGPGGV